MPLQPNQLLADLSIDAKVYLKHFYQQEASLVAAAPGRVNLKIGRASCRGRV